MANTPAFSSVESNMVFPLTLHRLEKNKNVVMNKFYAKAKIDKDDCNVADVLISNNQKPHQFHVFLPGVFGSMRAEFEYSSENTIIY